MPSDSISAVDAAKASADYASLAAAGAEASDGTISNPIDQERLDAVVRAAEAVQAQAIATMHAAEAAESGHIDVVT